MQEILTLTIAGGVHTAQIIGAPRSYGGRCCQGSSTTSSVIGDNIVVSQGGYFTSTAITEFDLAATILVDVDREGACLIIQERFLIFLKPII